MNDTLHASCISSILSRSLFDLCGRASVESSVTSSRQIPSLSRTWSHLDASDGKIMAGLVAELTMSEIGTRPFARPCCHPRKLGLDHLSCRMFNFYVSTIVSSPPIPAAPGSTTTPLPLPSSSSRRTSGPICLCPLLNNRSSNASL